MNRSEARGIVYSTLSGCYRFPDGRLVRWMEEGAWVKPLQRAFGLLIEGSGDFQPCWGAFVLEKREGMACEMMRDYRHLFINPFPGTDSPLCGSAHPDRWELQDVPGPGITIGSVSPGYGQNGYALQEDLRDVRDPIVNDFEFMGILADRAARLTGAEKIRLEEVQMDFFSRFLLPWVPRFCGRVAQEASLPFYRHLGELTGQFIDFEKNYLGVTEEGDAG